MEADPLLMLSISMNIQFYGFSLGATISLLIIIVLLVASALISGSEVAYFSLSPGDRQALSNQSDRKGQMVLKNLQHPDNLLATILVANNFVNVGIVMLSAYAMGELVNFAEAPVVGFIFQVILVTFFLLLFGEIIPKVYATRNPLGMARLMATPLYILGRIFSPINRMLIGSTSFVNKKLKKKKATSNISVDELSHALELTDDEEMSEDKEILKGIVKFGNKTAEEIMHPRVDVYAIEISESFDYLVNLINDSGFSRIPVFEESFDTIKGILYIKDLLPHLSAKNDFEWQTLIRPPFFVPESKKIDDLLQDFQKNKVHMAIVVDEYGGSSGIVTLEDVLEEIVGDITDEFDEDERYVTRISENKYLFEAKVDLDDFCKMIDVEEEVFDEVRGEADTLAGLILEIQGDIPKQNDVIEYKNYKFTIDKVGERRIKKIKVEVVGE